ncbi:hypothetical protein SEVIR_9G373500v4 [Setaria viridis]|uniref:Fe2OG dioxygenase domain-containing protein n=1 Tax=Setaria viridis TaxID=4556 RepID=A0A4U6T574_SETVI|nr:protein SRG1-like isoform X2 [Setaria viridis]TKV95598.1 hypothetical protein SEVIR_9G373500v2 [Setaria viridis]
MEAAAAKLISRDRITDAAATLFSTNFVKQIPERFIRTDELQAAGAVVSDGEAFELPVVDMAKLMDPESSASETAKLGSACRDWGFFQLTSHGVDEAVIQRMKESAAEFFSLPLESKNAIAFQGGGDKFQGFGHHFSGGSSAGKLDWAECVLLVTQPVQGRKTELWPANPPSFRGTLHKYSMEMTGLARRLLRFMAIDLGVSQEALLDAFFSGDAEKGQSMGMHHYPPCRHPEKVLGIPPHTDGLGLTVLLHADDTPGLQIKRGGRWFPVRPLPGAFVVNVGDILNVLTNGAYASVEHRVVPDAERGRTTVVVFQDASVDGMVKPFPELLGGDEAQARYNSIGKLEFTEGHFRALGEGTRFLESLKK